MLVRVVWPDCDFLDKHWGGRHIDAFWVECTEEEADLHVIPRMTERLSISIEDVARGSPDKDGESRVCFLITRDLSSIRPFDWYYPIGNLWNAYSPFRELPVGITIDTLDTLQSIEIPPDLRE